MAMGLEMYATLVPRKRQTIRTKTVFVKVSTTVTWWRTPTKQIQMVMLLATLVICAPSCLRGGILDLNNNGVGDGCEFQLAMTHYQACALSDGNHWMLGAECHF